MWKSWTFYTSIWRSFPDKYLTFDHNRAASLMFLVERAKKCLDFCATLYIMHLFICIIYGGWPASVTWWVVNITGLSLMALLGEYLCMRRELREIPISRYRSSKPFSVLTNSLKNYFYCLWFFQSSLLLGTTSLITLFMLLLP